MKLRKILCLLLCACMALGIVVMPSASAADNPGYFVKSDIEGGSFTVQVYLQGAAAYGGRLALSYDREVIELADASSLSKAVKSGSGVTLTTEGHDDSVLVGNGRVMFAWYSTKNSGLNATAGDKLVATITFNLLGGASESDFSRNTLGLYYVNATMVDGWMCSSEIIANVNGKLAAYRNTEVRDEYLCGLSYDYPNYDYIPPVTYNVAVNVKNIDDKALSATVLLDSIEGETDLNGDVSFKMQAGTYFYRISSPGYEVKTGYFIVSDKDEAFNVRLRSNGQIAIDLVDELQIGFAEGDSAESVTADLILPTETMYGTVSWVSDSDAVSERGVVRRGEDDIPVTLTATVTVGTVTVTRDFEIVVKSRLTAEQKNMAAVSQDKADLVIGYAPGDYEGSVTVNLTLPETGAAGSTISWEIDNEEIIYPTGMVRRGEYDTEVTATINRGDVTEIKTFTVTVKAADEIPQNPNNGQEEEIEEKNTIKRGGSGGGGGAQSAAEATPAPTAEPAATTEPAQSDTTDKIRFIDIDDVPWAQNAINTLADRGVITGTSANTYSPHLSIRRADFVMLLVKLYDLDTEIVETFEDVTEDKYYYSDVSKAKSLEIISGIDETHFNPESSITRQDMMTMTYRALKKLDKVKETENTDLTGFKDHKSISNYALDAVKYLVGTGAIHGDTDGNLNPLANTTRAETAVFLFGLTQ